MLKKLTGRPLWYKLWAGLVLVAAVYVLVRVLMGDLSRADYTVMVFVNLSVVLDAFLFPNRTPTSS